MLLEAMVVVGMVEVAMDLAAIMGAVAPAVTILLLTVLELAELVVVTVEVE